MKPKGLRKMMTIADRHSNKKLPPIEGVVTPATTAEGPRANKPLSRLEEVSGSHDLSLEVD